MSTPRQPAAIALVVWTLVVWTTRIGNIWGDQALSSGDKWGRTALALSFTALAVAAAIAMLRRAPWLRPAVVILAGWTVAVWAVRAVGIAAGDHDASFVVVHLMLAVISWVLAAVAWRAARRAPSGDPAPSAVG